MKELRAHAGQLEFFLDRAEEILAERERELPALREHDRPKHFREQCDQHGREFAARMRTQRRERIRFLEVEQTRVMVEDTATTMLISGLVLGIIGARLGFDPGLDDARLGRRFRPKGRSRDALSRLLERLLDEEPNADAKRAIEWLCSTDAVGSVVDEVEPDGTLWLHGRDGSVSPDALKRRLERLRADRRT